MPWCWGKQQAVTDATNVPLKYGKVAEPLLLKLHLLTGMLVHRCQPE
jgi:hypothetical protein